MYEDNDDKSKNKAVSPTVSPIALLKRYDKLKSDRSNWDQLWEELAIYLMPSKAGFISKSVKGTKRAAEVYDSTAIHALQILSASLHGSLTSPSTKWFGLRFREDQLNEDKEAKDWLEKCSKGMFQEFSKSNFSTEVAEAYQDMVGFGTATLQFDVKTKDANFDGFNFRACHLAEVVIAESVEGRIDTVFRKITLSARQAYQKFGKDCGEKAMKALDTDPDKELDYIQAVFPRELKGEPAMVAPPSQRPWACYFISVADKKICKESGYYDNTIIVLWSDHGYHLGEKEHWRKETLWEEATKNVLFIKAPGITGKNTFSDWPVSLMDIYPTLTDICGLPPQKANEGNNLKELLLNPEMDWDKPVVTTYGYKNHAVRSKRYKYIQYRDGSEELYDHLADPNEWHNFAGLTEYNFSL